MAAFEAVLAVDPTRLNFERVEARSSGAEQSIAWARQLARDGHSDSIWSRRRHQQLARQSLCIARRPPSSGGGERRGRARRL
jgi:hypothetical protein